MSVPAAGAGEPRKRYPPQSAPLGIGMVGSCAYMLRTVQSGTVAGFLTAEDPLPNGKCTNNNNREYNILIRKKMRIIKIIIYNTAKN